MGQTAVGKLLHLNIKEVGRRREARKSIATYEAAKWIGVISMPFSTTIVEHNSEVINELFLINRLPYTKGWIVRFRPETTVILAEHFVSAEKAQAIYAAQLDEGKLENCVHCLDFEV